MAGELHDNAEKQILAPAGVLGDAASLSQNTQTLFTPLAGIRAASELPTSLDFGNPTNLYGNDGLIAQRFDYDGRPPTLLPDFAIKAAIQVWEGTEHPLEGSEEKLMAATTAGNPSAWTDAARAFPQLNDVPVSLMKSYVRNELAFYGREDLAQDMAAANGQLLGENPTLGMTQITAKGIREFEQKYPQLKEFLESKGYTGPGHEMKALLDPECVPMIVAAKTASLVDDLRKHGIQNPTKEQLAYAYNPDVYSYSDGQNGRVFKTMYHPEIEVSKAMHWDQRKEYYANKPEVVNNSQHVQHVMTWLNRYE